MRVLGIASIVLLLCGRSTGENILALVDIAKTYDKANAFCQKFGFILVRINNEQIFDEIQQMTKTINNGIWVGLRLDTSQLPNYTYIYETGEPANFTMWAEDEPDDQDTDQCVRMGKGCYRTRPCYQLKFFICQKITDRVGIVQTSSSATTTFMSEFSTLHYHTTTYAANGITDNRTLTTAKQETGIPTNHKMSLEKRLEDIRKNLTIDKASLTIHQMRLVCATDDRTSSYSIGMTGAAIIIIVISILIIGDAVKLVLWIKRK